MTSSRPSIAGVLKAAPLFSELTEPEIEFLAARTALKSFSPGEMLFSEGEPCSGLFLIASGHVRIYKSSSSGREHILAVEGPGGSVAELPVFDGGDYPASASAADPAELVFISRQDFRAVCLEHPEVALRVLQVVGARLCITRYGSIRTDRNRIVGYTQDKSRFRKMTC